MGSDTLSLILFLIQTNQIILNHGSLMVKSEEQQILDLEEDEIASTGVKDMILFPGGHFLMGTDSYEPQAVIRGEAPVRRETVTRPFFLDRYPVTNAEFTRFVQATGYQGHTGADRKAFSYVFFAHLADNKTGVSTITKLVPNAGLPCEPWWLPVHRADWRSHSGDPDWWKRPVNHVDAADGEAYCTWRSQSLAHREDSFSSNALGWEKRSKITLRLPTEYEWEYAIKSGRHTSSRRFPWGQGYRRDRLNCWQGVFPAVDLALDGYNNVSPVDAFPAQTPEGLYDMLGNVWEWTQTAYKDPKSDSRAVNVDNHAGSANVSSIPCLYSRIAATKEGLDNEGLLVLKGGSYIDTLDGTMGTVIIRSSTRLARRYDFTAGNIGFRCAGNVILETEQKANMKVNYKRGKNSALAKSYLPTSHFRLSSATRFSDTWEYRKQQDKKMAEKAHKNEEL